MPTLKATEATLARLPDELRLALQAVEKPEVQEMIKVLAKYNLGVFMPHSHVKGDGKTGNGFAVLPTDMMSVEDDLKTSFIPRSEMISAGHGVPTGWRWIDGEAAVCVASGCFYSCDD
jgi:hypothetical protein